MNNKIKIGSMFLMLATILVVGTISMTTIPKSFATIAILPDVDEMSPLSCNNINVFVNTVSEDTAGAAAGAAAGNDQDASNDIPLLGALPGTNMQTGEAQDVEQENTNTKKSNSNGNGPNGNGQDQILEEQLKQKSIINVCQNITPNAVSGGDTTQTTEAVGKTGGDFSDAVDVVG